MSASEERFNLAWYKTEVGRLCDALEKAHDEIERLWNVTRWIPVTERLPEEDPRVPKHSEPHFEFCTVIATGFYAGSDKPSVSQTNRLINHRTGIEYIDSQAKVLDAWYWGGSFEKVTHWQPLPEPPKGE